MPGIEKLHLEDALFDSPQTRSLISLFEEDALRLKKYAAALYQCCARILSAQNELTVATQALSSHLKSYATMNFPLDDSDSILSSTMTQFANSIDEASSWHQILFSQLNDGMLFPLNKFIDVDLKEIMTLCELFQHSSSELDKALLKYSKISRKKESEREHLECNEELYANRKKFHQIALHYFASLNALQYKRKTALIEPLLGYLHAMKSHYMLGYEVLCNNDMDNFLSNISASVQGVHAELNTESRKTVDAIQTIEKQSQHLYHPEPTASMPYIPANTTLTQKSGYLFQRTKIAGVVSRWDQAYFFTQGGNLMSLGKGDVAGSLVIELDGGVTAVPLDQEDRRHIFQVSNGKKNIVLQCINERDRDEWICSIRNIIREGGYVKGKPPTKSSSRTSQSSIEKLPLSSSSQGSGQSGAKRSGPSTPSGLSLSNTPIVFDMISPSKQQKKFSPTSGLTRRINPFDQSSSTLVTESLRDSQSDFHEVFTVRFLGSIEVPYDKGDQLVHETIRHIMAARAIHNMFKMTESHMTVSESIIGLVDPSNQSTRAEFPLEDVSYWAAHHESQRLFGFITRTADGGQPNFNCYVFESNETGEEICHALRSATKIAYQKIIAKQNLEKTRASEKELLLYNLSLQADIEIEPILSSDRNCVLLENADTTTSTSVDLTEAEGATAMEPAAKESEA